MPRLRKRSVDVSDWPPALLRIISAAEAECPSGHAHALRELTSLALQKIPARGIFDPAARGEPEIFLAIESIANAHLELRAARAAWRQALQRSQLPLDRRDTIEDAALQVQTASDTAYFYAGLAFGLAFAAAYRVN